MHDAVELLAVSEQSLRSELLTMITKLIIWNHRSRNLRQAMRLDQRDDELVRGFV
jgi:hypothetical protein